MNSRLLRWYSSSFPASFSLSPASSPFSPVFLQNLLVFSDLLIPFQCFIILWISCICSRVLMASTSSNFSGSSNAKTGKSMIDDPLSPFFLHHLNSPSLVLVSQQLTSDNYASWSWARTIAISVKNKLVFVDGLISRPNGTDPALLSSWIRNNNIVISWILNSVSKEISTSILFIDSASEIWIDL